MIQLDIIYGQIPKSTCPDNCGKCCGILYPSRLELHNIKSWCLLHKIEVKDFSMTVGLDCPYLSPGKCCTIYSVRPFLCRMMGVSALPCPLGLCKPSRVLNPAESHYLYSQIYLHGKEKSRTERHRRALLPILRSLE